MQEDHVSFANMLYKKRYLIDPKICTCGRKQFFEFSENVEDSFLKFDHKMFLDENLNEIIDSSDEEEI